MGGAPPPRSGCARGLYSTFSHSATHLSSSVPLSLSDPTESGRESGAFAAVLPVGERGPPEASWPHDRVQIGRLHAACVPPGVRPTLRRPFRRWMWEGFGKGLRRDSIRMTPRRRARRSSAPSRRSPPPAAAESAGSGGDADPATLVPASAPIYVEAAVQPTRRAARRRARRRGQAPAHRRSRREAARSSSTTGSPRTAVG